MFTSSILRFAKDLRVFEDGLGVTIRIIVIADNVTVAAFVLPLLNATAFSALAPSLPITLFTNSHFHFFTQPRILGGEKRDLG